MNHFRHPRAIGIGAVAAGALILAGCSGSGGGAATGDEEFSLAYAVSNSAVTSPYKVLAQTYMKAHPDVKITTNEIPLDSYGQTLTTQLNAGSSSDAFQAAPGVGQTYSIVTLAENGLLAPLGPSAEAVIPAGSKSQLQVDGKTYGTALGLTFVGTVQNNTTAEKLGATAPTEWDALLSECGSLTQQGASMYALAGGMPPNTGLMALVISATRVYAADPTWNEERASGTVTFADSQGWKDTLQAVLDMKDAGCFQKGVQGAGFDAITNGMLQGTSVAAFVPANSASDLKQNAADQTFSINAFPPAAGGEPYAIAGADYAISLAKSSKHADAVKKFLDWAATKEGQKTFADAAGSLPVGSDLSGTIYAPVADIVEAKHYMPLPNSSWANAAVYDALGSGVQGLLTGQRTIDDVLKAMDAAWK
ncbi:extracellular solute-binding protein [Microbacterium horticulturae]|uniref:Extracellular solute-binding protein n=1 Tax=Microbacterium horticulturae TaxID=3028316 RepID=A0ABY8C0L7_9MICO|nr:extracellular solute-binding protein [Microbacterium sp. KACC 23027]WEG08398.1 extracellular solute-binding protein [Microbacterium sp. KACC 23027]